MGNGFTTFRVERIVRESSIISSFYLRPETPLERDFVPGEYLLFELALNGSGRLRREYSISGQKDGLLRVTIKHEVAPQLGLPDGLVSGHFHRQINEGDHVRAAGPMGQFNLDRKSGRPVVLLSGGVGLTPLVAMAHELAAGQRPTVFIHACENGAVHAMGQEIRALAGAHDSFSTHFCYREPVEGDVPGRDYDSTGFITRGTLEHLLPGGECDFYLCGPGPFMQAMYDLLLDMGISEERIAYEFFGPATVLKAKGRAPSPRPTAPDDAPMVTFAKSGLSVPWDGACANLLEFAEEQGVLIDHSCRSGSCDTCKTKVLSGDVRYAVEPFELPDKGFALMCCSFPEGDLELDV